MGNAQLSTSAARAALFCKARAKSDARSSATPPDAQMVQPLEADALEDLPELETVPECGICFDTYEEGLLQLECSHSFCQGCIHQQLQARWHGPRMSFAYLGCALCREPIRNSVLKPQIAMHLELQQQAQEVALKQFHRDGLVAELETRLGRKVDNAEILLHAVEEMAVFQCCDCKEAYCAGRMDCAAVQEHDGKPTRCPDCEWNATKDRNDHRCLLHGPRFALFKCDSCCSIAVWNCTSHHYCERCHNEAHMPKNYPCPGPELCPLGMAHPPNGEAVHCQEDCVSFCIGCTACLGYSEAQDTDVNERIALGFAEMYLRFQNGGELLALLGEHAVRERLRDIQGGTNDNFSAAHCAQVLLQLSVEQFRAAEKRDRERQQYQENPEAYWERRRQIEEEMDAEFARQDEEMRLFWLEVDAEAQTTSSMEPEWKMLRECRMAKNDVKALGKRLRLQHQQKRAQKQRQVQRNVSSTPSGKRKSKQRGLTAEVKESTRAADLVHLAEPVDLCMAEV